MSLDDRVMQFQCLELPGQPMMMHMGTSYLVHDLHSAVKSLEKERDALRSALTEIANRIEGDLCQTVRDVINGLADANDVYDDADTLERIARGALKTEEPTE